MQKTPSQSSPPPPAPPPAETEAEAEAEAEATVNSVCGEDRKKSSSDNVSTPPRCCDVNDEKDDHFDDNRHHRQSPPPPPPRNQLMPHKPGDSTWLEIERAPDPSGQEASSSSVPKFPPPRRPPQSMQSIGAFAVQCSRCMQWRLIPTKDKYEKIRENILGEPFYCEAARPDVTCADPPDISQDGSRVWAIDIPNIARPPPGWERLLRIRGEGSTKFADVYYVAPSGKRLRSMVEVQKHLLEHPEYISQGVDMSQFSFQTPKPLQENYLRKRPPRLTVKPNDGTSTRIAGSEPEEVSPLAWASPPSTDLQLGMPGPSNQSDPSSFGSPIDQPPSKKRFSKQMYNTPVLEGSSDGRKASPTI